MTLVPSRPHLSAHRVDLGSLERMCELVESLSPSEINGLPFMLTSFEAVPVVWTHV
jgi:hypothetical protein